MESKTRTKRAHQNKTIKRGGVIFRRTKKQGKTKHGITKKRNPTYLKASIISNPVLRSFMRNQDTRMYKERAFARKFAQEAEAQEAEAEAQEAEEPATKEALDAARVTLFDELERIVGERERERETIALLERKEQLQKERRDVDKRLNVRYVIPPEEIQSIALTKREKTEQINEIDAMLEARPGIMYRGNNFVIHPNFVTLGVGASKKASTRRDHPNGWAYLSAAPDKYGRVPRSRKLKMQWEEDFDVSLLLHGVCDSFFPNVERVYTTPNGYSFRKELCEKIESGIRLPNGTIIREGNLTYPILRHIIDRSIELIDNYGLFTLDLKPPNMGLKNGLGVFIDFSLDSSFLINPDCDTSDYKSVMILILLVYCYNFCVGDPTKLSREHLRELAREFIPDIAYRRLCEPDYRIENDPCLDLTFNRGIAPSFDTYERPEIFLRHYSIPIRGAPSNFDEIIRYFSS